MTRSGTATVLFTDLVGSTQLMGRLGDVAFDSLRGEHFDRLRQVIAAHDGQEVKNTGDGILATFASTVEALACAVQVEQATVRHGHRAEVPLALRVGISVGEVTFEDGDVFGTPVVEAARLVAAARPGQILATAVVRVLAGSRSPAPLTELGALELKGLAEPLAVCELAWEPEAASDAAIPLPPLITGAGRIFVGRHEELERLRQSWKEVLAGDRRLALLAGEPGIGKTRLAAELATSAHTDGAAVLAGRCDEDLGVPYQPFVEALRHYVTHAGEPRLGRHGGELVRLVPELAQLVPGLAEPLRSDPETERYRLFDALASWLSDVSAETPVLFVVDDLHWAAKPTLLLLRHVLRFAEPLRLLVIATYRDTDIGRGHPLTELLADLRRETGTSRLALSGLDAAAVAAFVEAAGGHGLSTEGEALARVIHDETEGNPFFVAEVLRHLYESGAIEQRDGRWSATAGVEDLGIPEGVRDVVGRRLSRLSDGANRTLAQAAVVGIEFELAIVAAVSGLDDDTLLEAMEEAEAARVVIEVPGAGPRYRFAHALVRATLYDELSAGRRVRLHRQVAEAIEEIHAGRLDDHLAALAHHYARAAAPAAETDKAVDYALRAGDRALAQLAHDEASTYYRSALDLLDTATGQPGSRDPRCLQLLNRLGEAQRRAGDPAHRRTLLDAARVAHECGDNEALAQAALANTRGSLMTAWNVVDDEKIQALEAALGAATADSPVRARLLATLALELVFADARDRRVELSNRAFEMARRVGDPETLAHVLNARYLTTMPGSIAERLADTAELVRAVDAVTDPLTRSRAWAMRYRAAIEAGRAAEADRFLEQAEDLVGDVRQPVTSWIWLYTRAGRALIAGRFEEAERLASEALEVGETTGQEARAVFAAQMFLSRWQQDRLGPETDALLAGVPREHWLPVFDAWQALSAVELGRLEEASRLLDGHSAPPFDFLWIASMSAWAVVVVRLNDTARAEALLESLRPFADHATGLAVLPTAAVSHYLGLLATTLGRYDEADGHFAAAAQIHEGLGAPAWLARSRMEWARMLLRRNSAGDGERAHHLLGAALTTATELGLGGVEREARQLTGKSR